MTQHAVDAPTAEQTTGHVTDAGGRVRRTQRDRRASTEKRLLEAALRLIARSGSRSMTVAAVAREAGYSRGIVSHQFGSKQELLSKAATYAQHAVGSGDDDSHGLAWLLGLVRNYLGPGDQEEVRRAFLIMWVEAVGDEPNLRRIYTERDVWFRELVADAIRWGIADATIRADVDPAAMAVAIVGQLRGIKLQQMLTPNIVPAGLVQREALEMIRRTLTP
jgi:AcrR family transcriptional regulator